MGWEEGEEGDGGEGSDSRRVGRARAELAMPPAQADPLIFFFSAGEAAPARLQSSPGRPARPELSKLTPAVDGESSGRKGVTGWVCMKYDGTGRKKEGDADERAQRLPASCGLSATARGTEEGKGVSSMNGR